MRVALDPAGILHELSGRVEGEVWTGEQRRDLYSRAACIYREVPLAVVWPRHAEDVAAVLRLASREGVPVTPRGAGSGVAGGSVGGGIVLDLSIHMGRVREIAADGSWVRADAGAVRQDLVERLAPLGRTFAPDPSSGPWCTLGGMVATNAAGPRSHLHGATREHLLEAEAVAADGTLLLLRPTDPDREEGPEADLARALRGIVREGAADIEADRPRTRKCSSGYALWELPGSGPVPLERLLCGSEGTLAVATSLRLRTVPLPGATVTAVLFPRGVQEAAEAADTLSGTGLAAIELLDDQVLALLRRAHGGRSPFPPGAGAALFLAADAAAEGEARALLDRALGLFPALPRRVAQQPEEARKLWALRDEASPVLKRFRGRRRPARFVEDGCVPTGRLGDYVRGMGRILGEHGLPAPLFGHAGDGHLHCNPHVDLEDPEELRRVEELVSAQAELLGALCGVPSGEHGDGRLRAATLPRLFPRSYPWMRRVKALFDPEGVLNPGAKVPPPGGRPAAVLQRVDPLAEDLRMDSLAQRRELLRRLAQDEGDEG